MRIKSSNLATSFEKLEAVLGILAKNAALVKAKEVTMAIIQGYMESCSKLKKIVWDFVYSNEALFKENL